MRDQSSQAGRRGGSGTAQGPWRKAGLSRGTEKRQAPGPAGQLRGRPGSQDPGIQGSRGRLLGVKWKQAQRRRWSITLALLSQRRGPRSPISETRAMTQELNKETGLTDLLCHAKRKFSKQACDLNRRTARSGPLWAKPPDQGSAPLWGRHRRGAQPGWELGPPPASSAEAEPPGQCSGSGTHTQVLGTS